MKNFLLIALILPCSSFAQTPSFSPPIPETPPPSEVAPPPDWKAEGMQLLMERFDVDKDGKLNDAEKRAVTAMAKKLLDEKRKAIFEKYDTNGNGRLDPDELATMRGDWERRNPGIGRRVRHRMRESRRDDRLELQRRFDKDGDGRMNEEECAAMRQWLHTRAGQQTGKHPHPPCPPRTGAIERGNEPLPPLPPSSRFGANETSHRHTNKEEIPGQRIVAEALLAEKHRWDQGHTLPPQGFPCTPPKPPQQDE